MWVVPVCIGALLSVPSRACGVTVLSRVGATIMPCTRRKSTKRVSLSSNKPVSLDSHCLWPSREWELDYRPSSPMCTWTP
eukprot:40893-Eustigmatos_ZCMA.PRE.1